MSVIANDIIELNGKRYICYKTAIYSDVKFVYLISESKPIEMKFAKEINQEGELKMEIINNPDEKAFAMSLFDTEEGNN